MKNALYIMATVASVFLSAGLFAGGQADFDGFAEGSPTKVLVDGGITFSNLDRRIPGEDPPVNLVIEQADGTLGGMDGFTPKNTLGFGGYSPGPGASFSRCGEFTISTGTVENYASIEVFQFGSGGNNVITLEARRNGEVVDSVTIPTGGFVILHDTMIIDGPDFDELRVVGSGPDNSGCFFGLIDHVVIGGPAGLELDPPSPGIGGMKNTLAAHNAEPNAKIYFVYGFQQGSTGVPGCPGTVVDIRKPKILGSSRADANGEAEFSFFVPGAAQGKSILFQAADQGNCEASNLVDWTFQ